MEQSNMTALISTFARWFHSQYDGIKVFDDTVAGDLLSEEEKKSIASGFDIVLPEDSDTLYQPDGTIDWEKIREELYHAISQL